MKSFLSHVCDLCEEGSRPTKLMQTKDGLVIYEICDRCVERAERIDLVDVKVSK